MRTPRCRHLLTSQAPHQQLPGMEGTHEEFGVLSFKNDAILFLVWILTPAGSGAQGLSLPQAEHFCSQIFLA